MFSEYEVATMIEIQGIREAVIPLKEQFVSEEASMLDISDHDFLSLILMTPSVGVALANGSISLFEELALNKMARRMSRGGFFLKADPVVHAMKFLIKSFDKWEPPFYDAIRLTMQVTFDMECLNRQSDNIFEDPIKAFAHDLMHVPHIFVNFMSSFVLTDEALTVGQRSISKVEFEKLEEIGNRLSLNEFPVFRSFLATFIVK
ncbi:MAG: hypothetical protein P8X57_04730 [Cyclobacteriaceae bacterium]